MHKVLGPMETLIEHNMCDQAIKEQVQVDHRLNVILRKKQTHVQLAQYLHKTCFSPTTTTFTKAIRKNNFLTWPGLTKALVSKYLPKSIATARGHMTSERKGLQSTTRPPVTHQQKFTDIKKKYLQLKMKIKPEAAQTIVNNIDEDYFPVS